MELQSRSNDRDGQQWQQLTSNRLRQALGRLHGLVEGMKVRLDDVNGPAGGVDKRCNVEVLGQGTGPVAVSATARTWQASVDAVAAAVASRPRHRGALQTHPATGMGGPTMAFAPGPAPARSKVPAVPPLRRAGPGSLTLPVP